jgi:hypothetical protein
VIIRAAKNFRTANWKNAKCDCAFVFKADFLSTEWLDRGSFQMPVEIAE